MSRHLVFLLVPGLAALASTACDGGQVGEENLGCEVVDSAAIGADEASPLGVVPADLIADLGGSFTGELGWADGDSAAAELELGYVGGPIVFEERAWLGDGELGAIDCEDVLAIEMQVAVSTADGRLAESWTGRVLTDAAGTSAMHIEIVDGFGGSLDLAAFVPPGDWDQPRSFAELAFAPTTATLTLSGQVSHSDDAAGDDGVATAESFAIGQLDAERP